MFSRRMDNVRLQKIQPLTLLVSAVVLLLLEVLSPFVNLVEFAEAVILCVGKGILFLH